MTKYMRVMDAMTRKPVVVGPEATLEECVKLMLKNNVGSLLIKENDILKGIVTEKDLVEKVILQTLNPKKTKINKIMSKVLVTVDSNSDILEAIKLMTKYGIRRLPVVDSESKLQGLLTVNDILRVQPELFEIIMDKSRLFASKRDFVDSECSNCKSYGFVRSVSGNMLCKNCERNERIINYLE